MPNPSSIRLDNLSLKAQEALTDFLKCIAEGFTGDLRIDFSKGEPQLRRRTDTVRYGKSTLDTQ